MITKNFPFRLLRTEEQIPLDPGGSFDRPFRLAPFYWMEGGTHHVTDKLAKVGTDGLKNSI